MPLVLNLYRVGRLKVVLEVEGKPCSSTDLGMCLLWPQYCPDDSPRNQWRRYNFSGPVQTVGVCSLSLSAKVAHHQRRETIVNTKQTAK